MGIGTFFVKGGDSFALNAFSSTENDVARLQDQRVGHLKQRVVGRVPATRQQPQRTNEKGRNKNAPASTFSGKLEKISL